MITDFCFPQQKLLKNVTEKKKNQWFKRWLSG